MKKKNLFYIIAATVVVVVILITTLFFSGGIVKSWRSSEIDPLAVAEVVNGDVSITRKGLNYTLKEGIVVREEDQILAGHGSSAIVKGIDCFSAVIESDSTLGIITLSENEFVVSVPKGNVYFDEVVSPNSEKLTVQTESVALVPESDAVFSVEAQSGTQSVNVYSGRVTVKHQGETSLLSAGEHLTAVQDDRGNTMVTYRQVALVELQESLIHLLQSAGGLCFTPQELSEELLFRENEALSVGRPISVYVPAEDEHVCTIEIRCDTVLDHLSQLSPQQLSEIPEDGVILPPTQVGFREGETVFEIARRLCDDQGITLSYSYTLVFGGYYIEGINGLAAQNIGTSSGWLYRVNGWFPNYGCGRYIVNNGDVISFVFSCEGWGADVGRDKW